MGSRMAHRLQSLLHVRRSSSSASTAIRLTLAAVLAVLVAASAAGASELTTTSNPPTSAEAPTTPVTTPSTAVPPPPGPDPVPGTEGAPEGTGDADPEDPLAGEGPAEDAPDVDISVPPPETYSDQEPYRPPPILWSSVAEAERKLERARQVKREAVAAVRALRLRSKHLGLQQEALDEATRDTIAELEDALVRYQGRAVSDFRLFAASVGPDSAQPLASGPTGLDEVMERRRGAHLAESALTVGESDLARLTRLRRELGDEARQLLETARLVAEFLGEAEREVVEADEAIDQAQIEYEAFRAGSEVYIHGVVFPIAGPYDRPLIDSFGFPRMTGTADEHWHEGIDLFAPRGTPLVAAERGVVTRIGNGRLGGLKLWLIGESGSEWYYAHLDSFAAGLHDGQVVEAGDLLGYVGTTGNAVGTPPHLHLQLHPGGGRPVDPYPLLAVVSRLDEEAMVDGVLPGWRHDPVIVEREPDPAPEPAAVEPAG